MRCTKRLREIYRSYFDEECVIARFVEHAISSRRSFEEECPFIRGAEYVIAVPTDVTEVEKKASMILCFILKRKQNQ